MNIELNKIVGQSRLGSMIVDQIVMTLLMMILFFPISIIFHIKNPAVIGSPLVRLQDSPIFFPYAALLISIYINKDFYQGRSIAKRIMGFEVIDINSGKLANPIQCALRNLTAMIWPIEVVAVLLNPNRRIGDLIAGTTVIPFTVTHERPKQNWILSFVSITGVWIVVILVRNLFVG